MNNFHSTVRLFCVLTATFAGAQNAVAQSNSQNASDANSEILEEVVVTGIRRSVLEAAARKRNAAQVVDGIAAEDIGKFPDQNVAESLQRITGVNIDRVGGEGTQITVRGLGPEFNIVSLNGRTIASVARGRQFDFRVLPTDLITGAEVAKSPTAKMPEGSIGGAVNIRTARPLDFPGLQIATTIEAQYNDLSEETGPRISGLISDTWANDTFGALLSVSYDEWDKRTDEVNGLWGIVTFDDDGDGETETYRAPVRVRYLLNEDQRERLGVVGTLQWQPSDALSTSLDLFYSSYDRTNEKRGVNAPLQFAGFENTVISEFDSVLAADKSFGPLDLYYTTDNAETETTAIGWNGTYDADGFKLGGDVSYSKADVAEIAYIISPGINVVNGVTNTASFDTRTGNVPSLTSLHSLNDPANVRIHFNNLSPVDRTDEVLEVRLDGEKFLDSRAFTSLQAGIFYTDREQDNQIASLVPFTCAINGVSLCGRSLDMPDDLLSSTSIGDFLSEASGNFPREFVFINDLAAYYAELRSITGTDEFGVPIDDLTGSSLNTESTFGAYIQANVAGEFKNGKEWSGNFGVRYVATDSGSQGYASELLDVEAEFPDGSTTGLIYTFGELMPLSASRTYSDWLPSVNFTFELEEWIQLRLAAAKVITRPTMDARNVASSTTGNFENVTTVAGNPLLEPFEAWQYDAGVEFYPENGDSYSIAFFYKDIGSFISEVTSIVDSGFIADPLGPVIISDVRSRNRPGGSVLGFELAGNHSFDYLPGFWSGFGVQANYTFSDSEDELANAEFGAAAAQAPDSGLEGFVKHSYNIIAYYEANQFQARIAYNWRDEYLATRFAGGGIPEHVDEYGQLDASAAYYFNDNFSVSLSAINLSDEYVYRYADVRERMNLVTYSGRIVSLGFRARF